MNQRVRRFLPEPRELHKALWLGTVLLAITSSYTLVKIARDALFLSRLPASSLPIVYLMVGVLTLVVTWIFGRATQRLAPLKTLTATALASALVLVGFGIAFHSQRSWLPMAFYVWVNIYGLILTSQFWVFTNSMSDPREAKRIFGIVGGGGILGGLLGGCAAAGFGQRVPLAWLTFVAAGLLVAMVVAILLAVRRGSMQKPEDLVDETEPRVPLMSLPYVRWLTLATLCSVVVTGLLDYQFKVVVQAIHPDAPGLASFFGRFFVVMNVAALALQLLGTRWLLHRLGAGPAAAVLPLGIAAGSAATLAAPGFVTVLGTRLWDQVLRFSLNKATTELFYFPLGPNLRRRAKAFIEAGIERFGDALAGLLILAAAMFFDTRPITLSAIVLVLVTFWLIAWMNLRLGYVRELARSLRRMNASSGGEVSLRERSVLKELARALGSPYERVVLQAVELLLQENAAKLIESRLPKLLEHPSPQVRARALELAGSNVSPEMRDALAALLRDRDPMVRLKALRARCALGEGRSLEPLDEFLDSTDPGLRATALSCLVEHATPGNLARVRSLIEQRLKGEVAVDRVTAAEALGARAYTPELHDLLAPLLDDPDPAVRRAALLSAGSAQIRELIPAMMKALASSETEASAREALLAFGDAVAGTLGDWLGNPSSAIEVRRAIPRVLRDVSTQNSIAALFRARDRGDSMLRYRVLKAMNRIRISDPTLTFPEDLVTEDLDFDVRELLLAEMHAKSRGEPTDVAERFLLRVLRERRDQAFNRMFRRLALLYPPRSMFAAYQGALATNPRVRGNALEYAESALSAEHRALVAPLLPDATPEERRALAETRYGIHPMDMDESLAELLESEDAWLRTCALYVAGRKREPKLLHRVEASLEASDEWVRETAGWAKLALLGA